MMTHALNIVWNLHKGIDLGFYDFDSQPYMFVVAFDWVVYNENIYDQKTESI
jgi:hypothetical protein